MNVCIVFLSFFSFAEFLPENILSVDLSVFTLCSRFAETKVVDEGSVAAPDILQVEPAGSEGDGGLVLR